MKFISVLFGFSTTTRMHVFSFWDDREGQQRMILTNYIPHNLRMARFGLGVLCM